MEPVDLGGMILAALFALPGQLWVAFLNNPLPWVTVALAFVGVILLKVLSNRVPPRRRTTRRGSRGR